MGYFKDAKDIAQQYKDNQNKSNGSPPTQQPKWNASNIAFIAIIFVAIVGAFVNSQSDEKTDIKSNNVQQTQVIVDDAWIPANFDSWYEDKDVAYRWLEGNEFDCGYGDACWGMMIISKKGCPNSLYAELSILDKNGVQIGYTNDSLSSALPLQKSKMIFRTYEDDAETARITKIRCY